MTLANACVCVCVCVCVCADPTAPLPLRGWPEYSRGAPPTALAWSNQGYGPGWVEASW